MTKETLKDWVKEWNLEDIINGVFREGMGFMAGKIPSEEATKTKKILTNELKRRIK